MGDEKNTTLSLSEEGPFINIAVVSSNELRLTFRDKKDSTPRFSQKYVSATPGDERTTYSHNVLLSIGTLLARSSKLNKSYPYRIHNLKHILFSKESPPSLSELAKSIRHLLAAWSMDCESDEKCIRPPSRKTLMNPEMRKVISKLQQLEGKSDIISLLYKNENENEVADLAAALAPPPSS